MILIGFRRARKCNDCAHEFLTAEIDEKFLNELANLRDNLTEKNRELIKHLGRSNKNLIKQIKTKASWFFREEDVPLELAEKLIKESAYWDHPAGYKTPAPKHAKRIDKNHHGWFIKFGANSFLVGSAIERCKATINNFIQRVSEGEILHTNELKGELEKCITGAVANFNGEEFGGYYPVSTGYMNFGTQAIKVDNAINFVIREAEIQDLFLH